MNATAPSSPIPANLVVGAADGGRLLDNLTSFARLLRKLGFAAAAQKTADAGAALALVKMANRRDVFWALAAVFVDDSSRLDIFREAFHLFWQREAAHGGIAAPRPQAANGEHKHEQISPRLLAAINAEARRRENENEREACASLTAGANEVLRGKDFEKMNAEEWSAAANVLQNMRPLMPPLQTRRLRPSPRGKTDLRRTAKMAMRTNGEALRLFRARRVVKTAAPVVIADISGSMSAYSRMFAHCVAALFRKDRRARAFLFGTKLSVVPRRGIKDMERAVANVARAAEDWQGGTRIGDSLAEFNRKWSRRVLPQGAVVMLATDGLERGGGLEVMRKETARLRRSCRALLWLNPLLRSRAYKPEAAGAKILHQHADRAHSIHNITSIEKLAESLNPSFPRTLPSFPRRRESPRTSDLRDSRLRGNDDGYDG